MIESATKSVETARTASGHEKLTLVIGIVALMLLSVVVFWRSITVGFLLDDYFHLDYFYRALHGDPGLLLRPFYSNWSFTSDSLTSYRPLISTSMALDYMFWQVNAFGFHLSNIMMFAGCSALVALVGYELARIQNLRSPVIPAMLGGLLFAVYPIHVESVAWIIGRVDVQCSLFYLLSFYSYLVYRRSEKAAALVGSAIAFLLALASKEMAVTLPAVIAVCDLLLLRKDSQEKRIAGFSRSVWLFWAVLAAFAVVRTSILGTLVGGYGGGDFKTFRHSLQNFADTSTLLKLLFGASDEIQVTKGLNIAAYVALGVAMMLAMVRSALSRPLLRLTAFFLIWAVITVLPTFQIWHIYPNLVGSRLFFLGSAPFCLLLAFGCAALTDKGLNNKPVLGIAGSVLSTVAATWLVALCANLTPWVEAGEQMSSLTVQVHQILSSTTPGDTVLFVDLPQDHHGAPMLGRPEFLKALCKPPFTGTDYGGAIVTAERPISGGHDYIYPGLLRTLIAKSSQAYLWHSKSGRYELWKTKAPKQFSVSADDQLASNKQLALDEPLTANAYRVVDAKELQWETYPDNKVAWLKVGPFDALNPLAISMQTATSVDGAAGVIMPQLIWRSDRSGEITNEMNPSTVNGATLVYVPGRQKNWTLNGPVQKIGFRFPRGCKTELTSVQLIALDTVQPKVEFANRSAKGFAIRTKGDDIWLYRPNHLPVTVSYDASKIPGVSGVCVYVSKAWQALPDAASSAEPEKKSVAWQKVFNNPTGTFEIPSELIDDNAVHQAAVVATDSLHKTRGISSEPRSLRVH